MSSNLLHRSYFAGSLKTAKQSLRPIARQIMVLAPILTALKDGHMTYLRLELSIVAASLVFFVPTNGSCAPQSTGTKQAAEARLAAVAKPKASSAAENIINTLAATHRFEQAAISPDGKKVAWVEDVITKRGVSTGDTVIHVEDLENRGHAKRISASTNDAIHAEGSVAWSPDSKRIAFLSDAVKAGQLQLYVMDGSGPAGSAKKLTQVKGFLSTPGWSPNNKTISVLFTENATRASGPLVAETPETGEIKDSFFEQRLALIDVASSPSAAPNPSAPTNKLRQISPADTYIYEYSWSPDGQHIVATAAQGNGDNNWYIAELNVLDVATGLMKSIYKPQLQIARPAWSPDGKHIAFIEGLMSDEPSVGGDIYVIPSGGGTANDITPGRKSSASWLTWTADNKILFAEILDADSSVSLIDPLNPTVSNLWRGAESITAGLWGPNLSVSADG